MPSHPCDPIAAENVLEQCYGTNWKTPAYKGVKKYFCAQNAVAVSLLVLIAVLALLARSRTKHTASAGALKK